MTVTVTHDLQCVCVTSVAGFRVLTRIIHHLRPSLPPAPSTRTQNIMEHEVDGWIAQLSQCKQLSEADVKRLCDKVRQFLLIHDKAGRHPDARRARGRRTPYMCVLILTSFSVVANTDAGDLDGGVECAACTVSSDSLRRYPWSIRTSWFLFHVTFGVHLCHACSLGLWLSSLSSRGCSMIFQNSSGSAATLLTPITSSWGTMLTEGTTRSRL